MSRLQQPYNDSIMSANLLKKPTQFLDARKSQDDGMTSFKSEDLSSDIMISSKMDDSRIYLFNPDAAEHNSINK